MGYGRSRGANCHPLKVRKVHPCNKCNHTIPSGAKVYKHEGWVEGRNSYPVWFYVCASCHMLQGLVDKKCDVEKQVWEPTAFVKDGVHYVQAFGKVEPIASDVKYLLIGGKLVWEKK